ncbi:MAG: maleylpyruvate isomerase family mycothiol-dependent enzyme [Actinobacteria bacterium]|nr:maleylpyruvate isomerase family mycothiol-dependent enzyme [Actinomycetota bacterium]
MQQLDLLAIVVSEADALATAARAAGPDAPVDTCPEWNVAKLVKHTGTTHRWARAVVASGGPVAPGSIDLDFPVDPSELPGWLVAGAAVFAAEAGVADQEAPCWSWGADQHVRFWPRRMAHETAVHRWDAQAVVGAPEPLDGALAVDGLDELFENLAFHPTLSGIRGSGESLHLHATDREGEWLLRRTDTGVEVSREHGKGDVAARGAASDLLLFLLGRADAGALEVFGNGTVLGEFRDSFRF